MQTILSLDCIPAGMEPFPAMDEEQFEFIKRVIDDCDYYILIIGGRYGSVDDEGISYTEKEYHYAIHKGLPVLAFLYDDLDRIPLGKSEVRETQRARLFQFREVVKKGRLVQFWSSIDDLNGKVAVSLSHFESERGLRLYRNEEVTLLRDFHTARDRCLSNDDSKGEVFGKHILSFVSNKMMRFPPHRRVLGSIW